MTNSENFDDGLTRVVKSREEIIKDTAIELHDYYEIYSGEEKWKSQDLCRGKPFNQLPLANQKVMLRMAELWLNEIETEKKKERQRIKKEIEKLIEFEHNLVTSKNKSGTKWKKSRGRIMAYRKILAHLENKNG